MVSNYTDGDVNASISIVDEPAIKLQVYGHDINTGGYSLTVSHVLQRKQEFGHYTIDITNNFGTIVVPLVIIAEGKPCSPRNVTIVKSTQNSVTLSWIRFHGGRAQTFVIQHSTDGLKWTNSSSVEGGLSTSQYPLNNTIGSLQPNTLYCFMMFAYNDLGRSDYSTVLNITTTAKDADFKSEPNIGIIAGGAVGGLVAAVIVIAIVFLLFRRHKKSQAFKAASEQTTEDFRLTEQPYQSLNLERDLSSTYEKLTTAKQNDTQRSSASAYDDLDSDKTNKHIYTGLQVDATAKPSTEEIAKERLYDNTRRMPPKEPIDNVSDQSLGKAVAGPEAVYSNLMLRNA